MEAPNTARSVPQPQSESTYCKEITDAAATATQKSITKRRPKRSVAAGDARVPITPPAAVAAVIQPTTSGPEATGGQHQGSQRQGAADAHAEYGHAGHPQHTSHPFLSFSLSLS